MKKIILPLLFYFVSSSLISQVVWEDNFDDPANWIVDNAGQTDPAQFGWDIGTTEQSWFFTTGINSTSVGNYAELKNGNYNNDSQLTNVTYNLTTAAPIDVQALGNTDQVTLSFLQYGALYNDDQQVQISTDGTNFVTVYTNNDREVFVGNNNGAIYANPDLVAVNLATFIAGNASSVWIRFTWTSRFPSDSNLAAWTTFGWFIDDVAITTNPEYDVLVTSTAWGTNGLTYYQIPLLQVAPIDFSANVFNNGTQTINNVTLDLSVNSSLVGSSSSVSIPSLSSDSLYVSFTPPNNTPGTYVISQSILSSEPDALPLNNTISDIIINTTNNVYARENGSATGVFEYQNFAGFEIGNMFQIHQDQDLAAISVQLGNDTPLGTEIYVKLYQVDQNFGDFVYLAESTGYTIGSSNDLNSLLTLQLLFPVTLSANNLYIAVIGSYSDMLSVATSGYSPPQTSFLLDNSDGTWYYTTSTPIVRLNLCTASPVNNTISVSDCSPYLSPGNNTYTQSGVYYETLRNIYGCDSVDLTINLTILNSPATSFNATVCQGDSYFWNGTGYSQSGAYSQTLSNQFGCDSIVTMYLNTAWIDSPSICIVGMDSLTNENRVVWEKPFASNIDSFYVYKETNVANVYNKVGATSYNQLSVFLDVNSNPAVQAYRYEISALDTCGNESPLSSPHKTIHLTINQGVGNSWNLIWSHYEGITFGSYNIYRGSNPSNMTLLTTIQSNLNSYSDLTPPSGAVYYQIELVNPVNCNPTKSVNYGVSRSNMVNSAESGLISLEEASIEIYPNPVIETLNVVIAEELLGISYEVIDFTGRVVLEGKILQENQPISMKTLSKGTYYLKISEGVFTSKIVKQ
jgi:hypothetical protein